MSLKICSLSSGSRGNCVYIASKTTKILIDAGISAKRIATSLRVLGVDCNDVSILLTHNHKDHTSGLNVFGKKYCPTVYVHSKSIGAHKFENYLSREFNFSPFVVGDITISPFEVSHDVPCVGFVIECLGKRICYATDIGIIKPFMVEMFSDCDIVFIESNHDVGMVENGDYPAMLKRRILSNNGHLSNADCGKFCSSIVKGRVKQIILGHLSDNNNYKELAFDTVRKALEDSGYIEGRDVKIEVAMQNVMSGLYEIC